VLVSVLVSVEVKVKAFRKKIRRWIPGDVATRIVACAR
jgi:hypothetical protein